MNWIAFAFLSAQLFTFVYFFDKFVVTSVIKDYRGMPIFGGITGFIVGTLFWFIAGSPVLPLVDACLLLLSGVFTIWAGVLYFGAVSKADTSLIIIICRLATVFTLIFSAIFLNQFISINQFIGFCIILLSILGISLSKGKHTGANGNGNIKSVIWRLMIANLMWSLASIFVGLALNATQFSHILSYESWGIGLGGLLMFIFLPNVRNAFFSGVKQGGIKSFALIFTNEIIFVTAKSVQFYTFTLGPIALVSVITDTQVFMGIILGIVLSLLFPKHFKENLSLKHIAGKLVWGVLIFIGILFVNS